MLLLSVQGGKQIFNLLYKTNMKSTVDPWTKWVWTMQVHLYADFFLVVNITVLRLPLYLSDNPSANVGDARDVGLIPGSERSPGEGNGNLLLCSCLENPMDRGAWWATVHGVTRVRHNWARTCSLQYCTIWERGTMHTEEPQNWKIQCKGIFQSVAKVEGHFTVPSPCAKRVWLQA